MTLSAIVRDAVVVAATVLIVITLFNVAWPAPTTTRKRSAVLRFQSFRSFANDDWTRLAVQLLRLPNGWVEQSGAKNYIMVSLLAVVVGLWLYVLAAVPLLVIVGVVLLLEAFAVPYLSTTLTKSQLRRIYRAQRYRYQQVFSLELLFLSALFLSNRPFYDALNELREAQPSDATEHFVEDIELFTRRISQERGGERGTFIGEAFVQLGTFYDIPEMSTVGKTLRSSAISVTDVADQMLSQSGFVVDKLLRDEVSTANRRARRVSYLGLGAAVVISLLSMVPIFVGLFASFRL